MFSRYLAVSEAPCAPAEARGALSHSAPHFTRPGHEDGDRSNAPRAVQREAVRRGADFLSLALRPLCECQRSIPLISQIDGIVKDFQHRQDKLKASADRYVTVETAVLQKRPLIRGMFVPQSTLWHSGHL